MTKAGKEGGDGGLCNDDRKTIMLMSVFVLRIGFLFAYLLVMAGEKGFKPSSASVLETGVLPIKLLSHGGGDRT